MAHLIEKVSPTAFPPHAYYSQSDCFTAYVEKKEAASWLEKNGNDNCGGLVCMQCNAIGAGLDSTAPPEHMDRSFSLLYSAIISH